MRWNFFSRAFEICLKKFCFKFSSFLRIPFFVTESKLDELTNAVKETDHIGSYRQLNSSAAHALLNWLSDSQASSTNDLDYFQCLEILQLAFYVNVDVLTAVVWNLRY